MDDIKKEMLFAAFCGFIGSLIGEWINWSDLGSIIVVLIMGYFIILEIRGM